MQPIWIKVGHAVCPSCSTQWMCPRTKVGEYEDCPYCRVPMRVEEAVPPPDFMGDVVTPETTEGTFDASG